MLTGYARSAGGSRRGHGVGPAGTTRQAPVPLRLLRRAARRRPRGARAQRRALRRRLRRCPAPHADRPAPPGGRAGARGAHRALAADWPVRPRARQEPARVRAGPVSPRPLRSCPRETRLKEFRQTRVRQLTNRLIAPLAWLGLAGKRTHNLTVVGRKSARRHSTPVQILFFDGERWLVAPYGERQWVRNARVAGMVDLTRALRTEHVRVQEGDRHTAAPVLREYLRKTRVTKPYFDANVDSPLEKFATEAPRPPVF